jgi:hypothetical protein
METVCLDLKLRSIRVVAGVLATLSTVSTATHIGCSGPGRGGSSVKLVANPHFSVPQGPYGVSETNPILVGGLGGSNRAANEDAYLARLRGPAGEPVSHRRLGSCCVFPTPNPHYGVGGALDRVEVTYPGLAEPVVLYLNAYDPGEPRAPAGFVLSE